MVPRCRLPDSRAPRPSVGDTLDVTEPSNPSGYTYPTQAAPQYPSPTGYAPPPRSGAGVAAVVAAIAVVVVMLGAGAFFLFGFGLHASSVVATTTFTGNGPPDGFTAEPIEPPVLTPLDTRITTPLLAAA